MNEREVMELWMHGKHRWWKARTRRIFGVCCAYRWAQRELRRRRKARKRRRGWA